MSKLRDWASVLIALVALAASGATLFVRMTAQAGDAPQQERIVRLETQQESTKQQFEEIRQRLARIENKLDDLRR